MSLSTQGPNFTQKYFVTSWSSPQDEFSDTFFVGMPGTQVAGDGDDIMVSTQSPEDFYGNPGRFFGGSGDDTINGSQLDDTLRGDRGADTFRLRFGEPKAWFVRSFRKAPLNEPQRFWHPRIRRSRRPHNG
jgi:hypothetical protein